MKIYKFILIVGFVIFITIPAQCKKVKGKIYYATDTVETYLDIPFFLISGEPNYRKLQKKVVAIDESGSRETLKPTDIKGFEFSTEGLKSVMLSKKDELNVLNALHSGGLFLRVEVAGKVMLFEYYLPIEGTFIYDFFYALSYSKLDVVKKNILQKEERPLKRVVSTNFKSDMSNYFFDCKELSMKIEAKIYIEDNLKAIVSYYNSECN